MSGEEEKKEFKPVDWIIKEIQKEFTWSAQHSFVMAYPGYPETAKEALSAWKELKEKRKTELSEVDRKRREEIYAIMEHEIPDLLPPKKDIRMRKDGVLKGRENWPRYFPLEGKWLRDDVEFVSNDGVIELYRWCQAGHFERSEGFNKKANPHLCSKCFNQIRKEIRNDKSPSNK